MSVAAVREMILSSNCAWPETVTELSASQHRGQFRLYEGPCGRLESVRDGWADAVVTSPPFNLGHGSPDFSDRLPTTRYKAVLRDMVHGAARVLAPSGLLIVDAAKWIGHKGDAKLALSDFINDVAVKAGLRPVARFCYESVEGEHMDGRGHSAEEYVTAFARRTARPRPPISNLKPRYRFGDGQPEDVWPPDLIADLISTFDLADKRIVDPFAGRGALLLEVLRSGGSVVGFEISMSRAQSLVEQAARCYSAGSVRGGR